jgi:mannose-6-phosphate isomerase-like protein (cupin superfamily)
MQLTSLSTAAPFTTKDGSTIREVAHTEAQSLAEATVPPGARTIRHFHRTSEELYLFTGGEGVMLLGGEERTVRAGDCVVIPPGEVHGLDNPGSTPLVLLCCCSPPYAHDDTVLVEEPGP